MLDFTCSPDNCTLAIRSYFVCGDAECGERTFGKLTGDLGSHRFDFREVGTGLSREWIFDHRAANGTSNEPPNFTTVFFTEVFTGGDKLADSHTRTVLDASCYDRV